MEAKRKGARSISQIPPSILEQLNRGEIESANLTEWLAVNHKELINNVLPEKYRIACTKSLDSLAKASIMQTIKCIAGCLLTEISKEESQDLQHQLTKHESDSVRCWAAYIIGLDDTQTLQNKLESIKCFAADSHFGVREIAWMAVREDIEKQLATAIAILSEWAMNTDANIRRFSCEVIRPKGVWCKQLEIMKQHPELALPILESLKSDSSRYVQDSVANWLNDASKSQPTFVIGLTEKWKKESPNAETSYIIKRALRSINK
ncbi:DNA alkylation repair protein [Bacteroides ihuae]|uniref:DNA alkylation repair protein n=1 Tax=Bacteroides ihuae TaxID=1852362 RepID=UPI0008D92CE5|nr:DNA alkylation repair protein [Bacteroides ihuae]